MQPRKIPKVFFIFLFLLILGHPIHAEIGTPTDNTVTLKKAVHFLTADGSDIAVEPGIYTLEEADQWLQLIPGERRNALLLEAHHTQHEEALDAPKAILTEEEANEYRLVLLLPDGRELEAIGSVSGIRSRAVKRRPSSRTRTQQRQASRIPTQSKNNMFSKKSKPIPKSPGQPNDPLAQRVQTLEQQVTSLQGLVNMLQGQLNTMASAIQIDNAGNLTITQAGTVTVQGTIVKINAGSITTQAGMSKFSGVVQADTVVTNSVVSSSYTPGAGNIW